MNKLIVVFCVVLAQTKDLTAHTVNVEQTEKYIRFQRSQQMQALQEFENQLEHFKKHYNSRVESLNVQIDLTSASIADMEGYLNSLELLSEESSKCVEKYGRKLPNIATAKDAINKCIQNANNEAKNFLTAPLKTKNEIEYYVNRNFESGLKKCAYNFDKKTEKYTSCITDLTSNTNTQISDYQKTFGTLMHAAECRATANIKVASECTYSFQTLTHSKISEASVNINNCLLGKDECKPCPAGCSEVQDLQVDYEKQTILNPFYKRKNHNGCLLLKIKN